LQREGQWCVENNGKEERRRTKVRKNNRPLNYNVEFSNIGPITRKKRRKYQNNDDCDAIITKTVGSFVETCWGASGWKLRDRKSNYAAVDGTMTTPGLFPIGVSNVSFHI
jgi:hypothetical protein